MKQSSVPELELGLAEVFNQRQLQTRGDDSELAACLRTFETASHMQTEARVSPRGSRVRA